jgi:hypothetical protein
MRFEYSKHNMASLEYWKQNMVSQISDEYSKLNMASLEYWKQNMVSQISDEYSKLNIFNIAYVSNIRNVTYLTSHAFRIFES